jgi:arylsulfatase
VLDAADVKYPNTYDGRHVDPVDGKSLVPFLQGQKFEGHEYLCWSNAHGKAVRQGNWKLVKSDDAPWELYDLEKDPIEVENRAEKYPDKVRKLRKIFDNWLKNN